MNNRLQLGQLAELPIFPTLGKVRAALAAGSAVLAAPPGSGKTTGVPPALLNEPWLTGKKIIMLEPRRLAARAAARRISTLLGEQCGETAGYRVRFESCITKRTRIEVVTEGILTRRIQLDPELHDVGLVIFDEFHERSLHADLALALCLDLQALRDDLRLLVMSATLDTTPIATLLGSAQVIRADGRAFPVEAAYLEREPSGDIVTTCLQGIRRVWTERQGDILVFLPGAYEIRETQSRLSDLLPAESLIVPLFSALERDEQDLALFPDPRGRRRVVLATSIAETSLTIEGIANVVDSGWSRLPAFHPASGMSSLTTVPVSRAAAAQRRGRAGRMGPGFCLRLWSEQRHSSLLPFHPPEIRCADLAPLVLELARWGVDDPAALRWLDPPPQRAVAEGRALLSQLGALDEKGKLTPLGGQMARLPLHPRLARMLLTARDRGQGALACDLAALLTERDILRHQVACQGAGLPARLHLLRATQWKAHGLRHAARHYRKLLDIKEESYDEDEAGSLVAIAFPDRIAGLRDGARHRYLLSCGRGARLLPDDPLTGSPYLAVAHLDAGEREGKIFLAAPLAINELEQQQPELWKWREIINWDEKEKRVKAVRRKELGALGLHEEHLADPDPTQVMAAMLRGIAKMGCAALPWTQAARSLQARIGSLAHWRANEGWPQLDDEQLMADLGWLTPYLDGVSRADQLKRLDLPAILLSLLSWEQRQALERLAPERLPAPTGSRIALEYRPGDAPIMAVRLQEMFGVRHTPTVCGGTIPVLLHLLSPARRPIQVTSDLAGFWQRSYPQVKKELKGRYPKHFWPDDPLRAEPTRVTNKQRRA